MVRSDEEIEEVLDEVNDQIEKGGSRWSGMTYEQGVQAALDWAMGNTDDHPYKE